MRFRTMRAGALGLCTLLLFALASGVTVAEPSDSNRLATIDDHTLKQSEVRAGGDAVTPTSASGDMMVVIDAGHGYVFGSNGREGYTGTQLNGIIEDVEVYDLSLRTRNKLDALPCCTFLTTRPRTDAQVVVVNGQNQYRDSPDWDGDDKAWFDAPVNTLNPNRTVSLETNRDRALYDRTYFANTRSTGTHSPGKIFLSMHFNSLEVKPTNRGALIMYPMCYNANKQPTTGPCANQSQIDLSLFLAEKICDRLRPHVPNRCNPAQDTRNLAVLREINDNIPGVVIEFINQRDPLDAALVTATNKDKWATAVKDGVVDFYNATP